MSEPKRILQVLGRLNRGGAENMVMNLYRAVDREKVQFDFVIHTDKHCDFTDEVLALGGKIFSAPRYNVKNHFTYKKWWKKFLREHPEYKIVHGHMYSIASIYLKIAKRYGCTTISHSHSSSAKSGIAGKVRLLTQLPLRNIPDWLFACSDKAGQWLYGKNVKNRKNYMLLTNAIDTDKYVYDSKIREKVRDEFNLGEKFVVGHVGRIFAPKNHKYLLEVFKEILKEKSDAMLMIVGTGPMENEVKEKVKELGLTENVIMTGVRSDVNELMQAMDCFVFPSLYEGLPVTVVEAQTAGLLCFVSDTVTDEVSLTDLVTMLSIEKSPKEWADLILEKTASFKRTNTRQLIIDAGYDIASTAEWLQKFYLEAGK